MLVKKPAIAIIAASLIAAFSGTAVFAADAPTESTSTSTTSTTSTTTTAATASPNLVPTYSTFAGSDANATALVDGLRNGKSITLTTSDSGTTGTTGTATSGSVTFTPATPKMGNGNVNIALALAQAELTKLGITEPTPEQIEAALNGGSITTSEGATTVPGVLTLRSEGQGWGLIAKTLGFKLGDVVSASKTDKNSAAIERRASADKGKSVERQEKTDRLAKADRPQKTERPEKVDRPMKVDRPEKVERPMKVERPERAERPQK